MTASDDDKPATKPATTPFAEHRVESVKPKPAAGSLDGAKKSSSAAPAKVREIGGPPGPEPTRYGDWQFNGKVTDF